MESRTLGCVLEWSPRQRAFHVESLAAMVMNNMARFAETVHLPDAFVPDYIPLAVFPTEEDATRAGQVLQTIRDDKPTKPGPEFWPE